jgi:rubrerythrin
MTDVIKELEEIAEVISIVIAREQNSIEYYANAYNKAISEHARKLFAELVEQEKGHEAKLRASLQELKAEVELERSKRAKHKG